jgi:hypothetical protein
MPQKTSRQQTIDAINRRIRDLNERSLSQLSQYISYLKWQEELWHSLLDEESRQPSGRTLAWQYDFLEHFPEATVASTRSSQLMEVKVGSAICGMVQQNALWQHPPLEGSAVCEYRPVVPADLESLHIHFAVGIRDGAIMEGENLCAFRIYVNGMRIWSTTKQSSNWERYVIDLPNLAGQEAVIQFMTDGLGDARWNWAVWGEPQLVGYSTAVVS